MKDDSKTKMDLTIGSKIKIGRTEYTIVDEFKDDNEKIFSYSNIICWNPNDEHWFLRR